MLLRRAVATCLVTGLVAALSLLAGCDDAASPAADGGATSAADETAAPTGPGSPSATTSDQPTYVALGDSYTAAPGVPQTEQTTGCLRSSGNYPALVAAALDAPYVDVSCSGATTLSLVGAQQTSAGVVPAQFEALGPQTTLVTLGIGGNDLDLFQTLVGTCAQLGLADPSGAPCQTQLGASAKGQDALLDKVATIGGRVTSALQGVRDRAPNARVVLVGYPQPVPARGTCPALPLAAGDYPYVRSVTIALDDALKAAARKTGSTYVDLVGPSRGHDICAGDDAWVNGLQTDLQRAIAFHPFAEEQQAVADLIVSQVRG